MTRDANNPTIDDDLDTTAPNHRVEIWQMPEPVFRKTSGRLPQGFGKDVASSDGGHVSGPPEQNTDSPPELAPGPVEPIPKSPTLKIVIVAMAIAAMIAFIVVFLTVVYFFFLRG